MRSIVTLGFPDRRVASQRGPRVVQNSLPDVPLENAKNASFVLASPEEKRLSVKFLVAADPTLTSSSIVK